MWGTSTANAEATASAWCTAKAEGATAEVVPLSPWGSGAQRADCKVTSASGAVSTYRFDQFCIGNGNFVAALQAGCFITAAQCPGGQTANTQGVCGGSCPKSGTGYPPGGGAWKTNGRIGINFCPPDSNNCVVRGSSAGEGEDGNTYIWGPYSYTGGACSSNDPPGSGPGTNPPPCPKGTCPGTISGNSVCKPCDITTSEDTSSGDSTETTTNPDGSTTTTSSGNGTTTTTTCAGGRCTTTTTSTSGPGTGTGTGGGSGGSAGGGASSPGSGSGSGSGTSGTGSSTTTTEESEDQFCAKNPKSVHCKEEESDTSWGGTCESQFVCDGDAVQCAQAQAAWKTTCSLQTDRNHGSVTEGNQAMQGTSNQSIRNELGMSSASDFSLASMLDETPLFGGAGGCPAGTSVSLGGGTYAISFGPLCDNARIAGVALQAFAYLVAAFIVFRRS